MRLWPWPMGSAMVLAKVVVHSREENIHSNFSNSVCYGSCSFPISIPICCWLAALSRPICMLCVSSFFLFPFIFLFMFYFYYFYFLLLDFLHDLLFLANFLDFKISIFAKCYGLQMLKCKSSKFE
jgi:hypothetical protein